MSRTSEVLKKLTIKKRFLEDELVYHQAKCLPKLVMGCTECRSLSSQILHTAALIFQEERALRGPPTPGGTG